MSVFRSDFPSVISTSCSWYTALFLVPSRLVQQTTYILFILASITGVPRIPHRMLTPHRSISVALGKPGWGVGFGLIGLPRFVGVFQIGLPSLASKAHILFAMVHT